jgi:hypothetical protein
MRENVATIKRPRDDSVRAGDDGGILHERRVGKIRLRLEYRDLQPAPSQRVTIASVLIEREVEIGRSQRRRRNALRERGTRRPHDRTRELHSGHATAS